MAYKPPSGARPPMSEEARARIAQAMREKANERRVAQGLPPIDYDAPPVPGSAPYGGYTPQPQFIDKPLELVKMKDQHFSPDLFIPMKTGKPVDIVFTNEGGVPKACNFMIVGDPGVGKSTVALDILSDLALAGYRCLFISAEMTRIDLYGYVQRYPKFGNVDILFTGEYCDSNPKTVIENALKPGYDVVLIDSFAEVQEDIKEVLRTSTMGAEKWIIDIMVSNNLGNNDTNTNTTFLVIQQVTKGGVFVGSNKLKHNTTGMLELRFDSQTTQYLVFSKNRRGSSGKRMFYSLAETGDVKYDIKRFTNDEEAREAMTKERKLLEEESAAFDKTFGFGEFADDADEEFDDDDH
jgi:predicted ATP-dependent serine protease